MTIEKRLLDEAIRYGQEMEKERDRMVETMVQMQDRLTGLERHCERVADVVTSNKNPRGQDECGPAMQAMPERGKSFVSTLERDAINLLRKLAANSDVVPSRMAEVRDFLRRAQG